MHRHVGGRGGGEGRRGHREVGGRWWRRQQKLLRGLMWQRLRWWFAEGLRWRINIRSQSGGRVQWKCGCCRGGRFGFVSVVYMGLEVSLAKIGPPTLCALGALEDTTQ